MSCLGGRVKTLLDMENQKRDENRDEDPGERSVKQADG
jgi:hypothetical protein